MFGTYNAEYYNTSALYESKWEEEGVLTGLPKETQHDRTVRRATAVMCEHQELANEQLSPASATSTGTDDIAQFKRITIPMVRRYFPQLIAHYTVGVQPLTSSAGYVYYMRFSAGITKGNQAGIDNAAGDVRYTGNPSVDATSGWDNTSLQQRADGTAVVPIWFSHQRVHKETISDSSVSGSGPYVYSFAMARVPVLTDSLTATPNDATDLGGAIDAGANYTAIAVIKYNGVTRAYVKLSSTFSGSGAVVNVTGTTISGMTAVSGVTVDTSTGIISVSFATNPAAADTALTALTITDLTYEYNLECQRDLPRVVLRVESANIVSKIRKLRADWSVEAAQDLKSSHNLDVEAEITSFLAEQVNLEIDREIIEDLRQNAGTALGWDFNSSLGSTIKEKFESLYVRSIQASNQIHKKTLRAGANWMIASPEVCAVFETATAGFAPAASNGWETTIGIQYVGTVMTKFKVFKDPAAPTNSLLMGYRGDGNMDVGYFYCPYIALLQGDTLRDPESGCYRKGVMTRYGKILLREGGRYFARVTLLNFLNY